MDIWSLDATALSAAIAKRELSSVEITRACLERIHEWNDTLHAFVYLDEEAALAVAREAESRDRKERSAFAAARYPDRLQGRHRRRGDADDCRLAAPGEQCAGARLRRGGAAARRGHDRARKVEHVRVCDRRPRTFRRDAQSLESLLCDRRIEHRTRSRARGTTRPACARYGHRRLRSHSRVVLRSRRLARDARAHRALRRRAAQQDARRGRSDGAQRRRLVPCSSRRWPAQSSTRSNKPYKVYASAFRSSCGLRAPRTSSDAWKRRSRRCAISVRRSKRCASRVRATVPWRVGRSPTTKRTVDHRERLQLAARDYTPMFYNKISSAGMLTPEELENAQRIGRQITVEFADALARVDAIVLPATPDAAYPLGSQHLQLDNGAFTRPVSLAGLPGLVLPWGFTRDGLPLGMQLVGPAMDEARLFAIGRRRRSRDRAGIWQFRHSRARRSRARSNRSARR